MKRAHQYALKHPASRAGCTGCILPFRTTGIEYGPVPSAILLSCASPLTLNPRVRAPQGWSVSIGNCNISPLVWLSHTGSAQIITSPAMAEHPVNDCRQAETPIQNGRRSDFEFWAGSRLSVNYCLVKDELRMGLWPTHWDENRSGELSFDGAACCGRLRSRF